MAGLPAGRIGHPGIQQGPNLLIRGYSTVLLDFVLTPFDGYFSPDLSDLSMFKDIFAIGFPS